MRKISRGTALLASAAALSMIATPALARDRWGGWGGRHHHDGIDAGDVIAGVLILGGIAAIASAASNSNKAKQQREREYRYPDDNGTYGGGYERPQDAGYGNDTRPQWNQEASGGINAADFEGGVLPSGTVIFTPGSAEQVLTLKIASDTTLEMHENLTVNLSNPINGTLQRAAAIGTILNDDQLLIKIGDAPVQARPDVWEQSWTNEHVSITHKADLTNVHEAYSRVLFSTANSGKLEGGDIFQGDLGVSGQTQKSSAIRQEIDGTEGLRFSLDQEATRITFNLSSFFTNDDKTGMTEAGRVQFLNLNQIVKEVYFSADNSNGEKEISIELPAGFTDVVFASGALNNGNFVYGAYGNGAGSGFGAAPTAKHGSDYLIDDVSFGFGEIIPIGSTLPHNSIDPFVI